MWIYRAWITDKNGNRIYAKARGKRAFKIWIDAPETKDSSDKDE